MTKVKEDTLFLSEKSKDLFPKIDFADTFSTTNHTDSIERISNLIFNTSPKWVEALFRIRNAIARLFGLKTTLPDDYNEGFKVGGYIKFFKIYDISTDETVLGANDSHLNFRAIISNTGEETFNIKVTTLVEYNNRMGKVYMTIVKPFHRVVIKVMVKKAYVPLSTLKSNL